ncbi:MAG: hypothetical protein GKR92_02180 [Gammaproteobacteria bacterium]|nr:MAG: hypothetical protein GKR92_02180 [Gammaproteobacteria bacterium]
MHNDINPTQLIPGTVIAIRYPMYKHLAIVSDHIMNGMPNLISLSFRTNGAEEEPWSTVVGNHTVEQSYIQGHHPKEIVLLRARSYINKNIKYKLLTFNCEHFARYAHGLSIESIQVKRALYGAILGAVTCALLPKFTVTRLALIITASTVTSLKSSLHKI